MKTSLQDWRCVFLPLVFLLFSPFVDAREPNKIGGYLEESIISGNLRKTLEQPLTEILSELQKKDSYTFEHSLRVGKYARILAQEMGMSASMTEEVFVEGILHDVGKLTVPDAILKKPGKLTPEEFEQIKKHPSSGETILQKNPALSHYSKGAKEHHERWDGKGYPNSLKENQISPEGRIIAVADSFDAMTSQRPYNKPKNLMEALKEIEANQGSQFDPEIVRAFSSAVKKGTISIILQTM